MGLLFEQASARGLIQESIHGPLSFPFAIRNQVRTALSALKAAQELRTEPAIASARFLYLPQPREAESSAIKAYVFGDPDDMARTHHFLDILQQHHIQIYDLARPMRVGGQTFQPGSAYIIPTAATAIPLAHQPV